MLTELKNKINTLGRGLIEKLIENPSIEKFLELSHEFTLKLGIIDKKITDKIEQILKPLERKGVILGHYYKKNILVIVTQTPNTATVEELLRKHRLNTLTHKPSPGGIKIETQ